MKTIINKGSSFESFLDEEGILDEVDEAAVKRVIAWQVEREMAVRKFTGPHWLAGWTTASHEGNRQRRGGAPEVCAIAAWGAR
jgi:hypothetical protein